MTGTYEGVRPDATLAFAFDHVYGDDGTFSVTVCGRDDDTTVCSVRAVIVTNVLPDPTIDTSGTTLLNGVPTLVTHVGTSVTLRARTTDPGSDDLTLTWDWDDGSPSTVTTSLVNPPAADPPLSPSVQPRDVLDTQAHAFTGACRYDIGYRAVDDDDDVRAGIDALVALVTGNATRNRSAGYWYSSFDRRNSPFTPAELACLLEIADFASRVFSELTPAQTLALARSVLNPPTTRTTAAQQLDRQLLAAWLNFANGSVDLTSLVDTNGDRRVDTPFLTVMVTAETVRLAAGSTSAQLVAQKDVVERLNLRDGG